MRSSPAPRVALQGGRGSPRGAVQARGRYYCGSEDAAANVVVVGGSELFVDVMREGADCRITRRPELHAPYVPKELERAMERGLAGFSPSSVCVASPGESPPGETSTMRANKVGSTKATFEHRGASATRGTPRHWFAPRRARSHAVVVRGEGSGRAALRASREVRPTASPVEDRGDDEGASAPGCRRGKCSRRRGREAQATAEHVRGVLRGEAGDAG